MFDHLAPDEYPALQTLQWFFDIFFWQNNLYFEIVAWPIAIVVIGYIVARLSRYEILFNRYFLLVKFGTMMFFHLLYQSWMYEIFFDSLTNRQWFAVQYFACFAGMVLVRQIALVYLAKQRKAWKFDLASAIAELFAYHFVYYELMVLLGHASHVVNSTMSYPGGLSQLGPFAFLFIHARPLQVFVAVAVVFACSVLFVKWLGRQSLLGDRGWFAFKCGLMAAYTLLIHDGDLDRLFRWFGWPSLRWTFFMLVIIAARQYYVRRRLRRPELRLPDLIASLSEPVLITFLLRMFEVYVRNGGKSSLLY